jgi:hypothetical protein
MCRTARHKKPGQLVEATPTEAKRRLTWEDDREDLVSVVGDHVRDVLVVPEEEGALRHLEVRAADRLADLLEQGLQQGLELLRLRQLQNLLQLVQVQNLLARIRDRPVLDQTQQHGNRKLQRATKHEARADTKPAGSAHAYVRVLVDELRDAVRQLLVEGRQVADLERRRSVELRSEFRGQDCSGPCAWE